MTKADVSSLEEVYEVCKGADAVISAFNPDGIILIYMMRQLKSI